MSQMRNGFLKGKVSCTELGLTRKKIQEVAGIAMAEGKNLSDFNGLRKLWGLLDCCKCMFMGDIDHQSG